MSVALPGGEDAEDVSLLWGEVHIQRETAGNVRFEEVVVCVKRKC